LDAIAWTQRQWFDWSGLPVCVVSRGGLIEMELTAERDIDQIDIKQLWLSLATAKPIAKTPPLPRKKETGTSKSSNDTPPACHPIDDGEFHLPASSQHHQI
jgi:hypothetical protein